MNDILLTTIKLILVMVDISECIQDLPFELQWEIGQYLNLYFPLSVESAQAIINNDNYQRYMNHVLQRDNVEQLRIVLAVISSFDDIQKYIDKLTLECAQFGFLECLKFLTEQGYYKHDEATYYAAKNGHLACLQYLTEQGYPKHEDATWAAALNGHLDCLQYLTEQGYHKHHLATACAARKGHLACYEYCLAHGYDSSWLW